VFLRVTFRRECCLSSAGCSPARSQGICLQNAERAGAHINGFGAILCLEVLPFHTRNAIVYNGHTNLSFKFDSLLNLRCLLEIKGRVAKSEI
jgi:hypothetical protein